VWDQPFFQLDIAHGESEPPKERSRFSKVPPKIYLVFRFEKTFKEVIKRTDCYCSVTHAKFGFNLLKAVKGKHHPRPVSEFLLSSLQLACQGNNDVGY
jgi:hypothetical protein